MKPKISFRLKDNKNPTLIYMHVNCGLKVRDTLTGEIKYTPVIISTGNQISPEDWDKSSKLPTSTFSKKDKRVLISLNNFEKIANDAIMAISLDDNLQLDAKTIKREVLKRTGKEKKNKISDNTVFSTFINSKLESTEYNKNTLKGHKSFLKKVEDFEEKYGKILLEELSKETIHRFFFDFLRSKQEYTNNSLAKIRGRFSTFLNQAKSQGINIGCTMEESGISFKRYTPDDIRLNWDELNTLMNLEVDSEYKKRVRDIFVILCLTGQRISEYPLFFESSIITKEVGEVEISYMKLVPSQINNKKKVVYIPILKPVMDIIGEKHEFPEQVPEQKLNEIIKDLCEDSGIDQRQEIVDYVDGEKTKKRSLMKFQMVKSHTARRSFISNFLELGIPDDCLSRITGHRLNYRASKAFSSYVKLDDEVNIGRFFKELEFITKLEQSNIPMQLF